MPKVESTAGNDKKKTSRKKRVIRKMKERKKANAALVPLVRNK